MFEVMMEYWYHGMPVDSEDDYIIQTQKALTLEFAEEIARRFLLEAINTLNEHRVEWGYEYPGQRIDGYGTIYRISGGGENFEINIRKAERDD